MPTHLMCDIETLGLKPGNVVLSAAFVRFDDLASTSVQIHIGEQQAVGLTINEGTRAWWSQQSPAAQAAAFAPAPPLRDALAHIATWLQWASQGASGQEFFLWCHGAGFDAPMLAEVFERAGVPVPWTYRQIRDTRTLYDLAAVELANYAGGTYHNALDDAMAQTRAAVEAMNRIAGAMMPQPQRRFFYHPESDSLFFTDDGSRPIGDGLVEEIEPGEYIRILGCQKAALQVGRVAA